MVALSATVIRDYVRSRVELGDYSTESADAVRWALMSFARSTGPVPVDELTATHVRQWVGSAHRQPATIKSMLGKLRPFARWLVETGQAPKDFTVGVRSPKILDGLPRCLGPDECGAVLSSCPDERARLVVLLMLHCGLRVGEVAALRLEDVDRRRHVALVRGKGGRGRPTRSVPIPDQAWRQLVRFTDGRHRGAVVRSYQPPYGHLRAGSLSALVREWMTDAGIKSGAWDGRSAHACRHTAAQDLVDQGVDIRVVQRLLGHRSVRTTEDYTRRDPPGLREAIEGRKYE
jgi:integrase/recombinase XerC